MVGCHFRFRCKNPGHSRVNLVDLQGKCYDCMGSCPPENDFKNIYLNNLLTKKSLNFVWVLIIKCEAQRQ
jgi:hypothetical protein